MSDFSGIDRFSWWGAFYAKERYIMKSARKQARAWLNKALRGPFDEVIYQAKLTPRQLKIIEMKHLEGLCNYQIAAALSISPETVRDEMALVYDRISMAIGERWKNFLNCY